MALVSAGMIEKPLTPGRSLAAPRPGRRIYAVGDVHGHLDRLRRVHESIRADLAARPVPEPVLVHLGDLIDRGPESAGCIALLAQGVPIPGVPTVNLLGNHEWLMLKALEPDSHGDVDRWLDNGGDKALASWGLRSTDKPGAWLGAIPARHLVLLQGLRRSWVRDGYVFAHAGVRPGVPLAAQREVDLLWIREAFLNWEGVMLPEAPDRVIVHGHTPVAEPVIKHNRIGIDTGAGKGGPLTCAVLDADAVRLIQH